MKSVDPTRCRQQAHPNTEPIIPRFQSQCQLPSSIQCKLRRGIVRSGGTFLYRLRCGLSGFFRTTDWACAVACRLDNPQLHHALCEQPQGPARMAFRRLPSRARQGIRCRAAEQPVAKAAPPLGHRRSRAWAASPAVSSQCRFQTFLDKTAACSIDRRRACLQRLGDAGIIPPAPTGSDIRLDQNARFELPVRRIATFADFAFKVGRFLCAQPNHIFRRSPFLGHLKHLPKPFSREIQENHEMATHTNPPNH